MSAVCGHSSVPRALHTRRKPLHAWMTKRTCVRAWFDGSVLPSLQVREAHAASERSAASLLPRQRKPILQRLSSRLRNLAAGVKGPDSPTQIRLTVYPDAPHAYLTCTPESAPEDVADARLSSKEAAGEREVEMRQKLLAELSDVDDFLAAEEDDFTSEENNICGQEDDEKQQEQLQSQSQEEEEEEEEEEQQPQQSS